MTQVFTFLSTGFLPIMSAVIIFYGLWKRAPIYDFFIEGAKNGLKTAIEILPFLIGIFFAINSLTSSGILNMIDIVLSPVLTALEVPAQLLPLMFLRAISGSGSLIILQDILENVGPDSYAGRVACVMTGGCETIIYVLALYFGVTKVKQMRHAFKGGLIGYVTGIIVSIIICKFM
ncbi:MAG: spore maturation protein [Firmicutes bacterium]|jgi:spore maturation protein B|nr:spore maturation protein [Bacillota bacterium]